MAYQLLFMHGMSWTAAGDASLIIPMNPVFTILLAVPMLGQKISSRMSVGLLIGISGVAVVVGWSPNSGIPLEHRAIGDLMILFAALSWAATTNLTKIMLSWDRGYSSLEIVVWYSVTGWVLLSPWVIVENWGTPIPYPSEAEWVTIAYLGIVSTVLSYVLFARGIEVIGPYCHVFVRLPCSSVWSYWGMVASRRGSRRLDATRIHSDCIRSYRSAKGKRTVIR